MDEKIKLIDANKIPFTNDLKYPHVEGFQTVTKMAIDNMPTVEAIPIEWILLYIQEYPYMTASSMLHYWSLDQAIERKEE